MASFIVSFSYTFVFFVFVLIHLNSAEFDSVFPLNNDEPCVCIPFYQCNDTTGEVVSDGKFLLDQRIYGANECDGDFDVCCKLGDIKTTKKKTTKSPIIRSTISRGCGYHEDDILAWAATMLYQRADKVFPPTYKCGASIIHKDAVITAAHCLEEEGYYYIKIGDSTRKLYSVSIHPEFQMGSLQHDIAVITLRRINDKPNDPFFSCISNTPNVPNNTECVAATFNSDKNKLEKIKVPYVDPQTCTERLKTTRLGQFFELHESFVCAGGSDKDTCVGDGGNPLICPIPGQPGRYNQVGIVSWGIGCGKKGIPGVYVNISHVRDWIDGVLEHFGKDTKGYKN